MESMASMSSQMSCRSRVRCGTAFPSVTRAKSHWVKLISDLPLYRIYSGRIRTIKKGRGN
jgi:hypothetical protein